MYGLNFGSKEDANVFASAMMHALEVLNSQETGPTLPRQNSQLPAQVQNGPSQEELEIQRRQLQEQQRQKELERERVERERVERVERERLEQEQLEREREREQRERERQDRLERERLERLDREREQRERQEQREREQRERQEQLEREQLEWERERERRLSAAGKECMPCSPAPCLGGCLGVRGRAWVVGARTGGAPGQGKMCSTCCFTTFLVLSRIYCLEIWESF